jgi:hypothetical protein
VAARRLTCWLPPTCFCFPTCIAVSDVEIGPCLFIFFSCCIGQLLQSLSSRAHVGYLVVHRRTARACRFIVRNVYENIMRRARVFGIATAIADARLFDSVIHFVQWCESGTYRVRMVMEKMRDVLVRVCMDASGGWRLWYWSGSTNITLFVKPMFRMLGGLSSRWFSSTSLSLWVCNMTTDAVASRRVALAR